MQLFVFWWQTIDKLKRVNRTKFFSNLVRHIFCKFGNQNNFYYFFRFPCWKKKQKNLNFNCSMYLLCWFANSKTLQKNVTLNDLSLLLFYLPLVFINATIFQVGQCSTIILRITNKYSQKEATISSSIMKPVKWV